MSPAERDAVLEAVAAAVLHCPQLVKSVVVCEHCGRELDLKSTLGQRVNAAKQVRAAVARRIANSDFHEPSTA